MSFQFYTNCTKLKENNESKIWSPLVTHYKAEKPGLKPHIKNSQIRGNRGLTASNEKQIIPQMYEYYYDSEKDTIVNQITINCKFEMKF